MNPHRPILKKVTKKKKKKNRMNSNQTEPFVFSFTFLFCSNFSFCVFIRYEYLAVVCDACVVVSISICIFSVVGFTVVVKNCVPNCFVTNGVVRNVDDITYGRSDIKFISFSFCLL